MADLSRKRMPMHDIRTDAWQARTNAVNVDWKELCEQNNYHLATALRERANVSYRRINWTNVATIVIFLGSLIGAYFELK